MKSTVGTEYKPRGQKLGQFFSARYARYGAYLGTYLKVRLDRSPFMERGEFFKDFVVTKIISGRTDGPI